LKRTKPRIAALARTSRNLTDQPTDEYELSFLGLCTHYWRFIGEFVDIGTGSCKKSRVSTGPQKQKPPSGLRVPAYSIHPRIPVASGKLKY
jgi:hypothetical protein